MINQHKDGLIQWHIALLSQMSCTTVNRFINSSSIQPLDLNTSRNQRFSISDSRRIISTLRNKNNKNIFSKKKFAFYNFKGGTGKTSICFQIATHVALMGYNVLVIDTDPQGHLSTSCGFPNDNNFLTLYDLLIQRIPFQEVKQQIFEGLDCIPANLSLTRLEVELNQLPKREERFNIDLKALEQKYDFIFLDTNPTISLLNRNVVTFCDVINIICETQPYSLNGLKLLMEDLERFYAHMLISTKDINIIPNKYEDRASSSAEAMTALRDFYSDYVRPDFAIRRSEDINTAAKLGKPLTFFAKKNSNALADIIDLVNYLLEKYIKKI
jgi:chromosome partitioning protein